MDLDFQFACSNHTLAGWMCILGMFSFLNWVNLLQVCDIVVESPDPHIACRRVLDAALYEWEERMSADNITVLVVEFEWNEDGVAPNIEHATATASR